MANKEEEIVNEEVAKEKEVVNEKEVANEGEIKQDPKEFSDEVTPKFKLIKNNNYKEVVEENSETIDEDNNKENDDIIDLSRLEQMSDDEAVIELDKLTGKNDEILEKDYLSSLVSQDDRLIYYEVENIYNDPKKKVFRNRLKMRRDPPVLVIRDDFENEAKFYLTENLTDELSETLRQVKRAYYGFNNPSDIHMPEKFIDKIKYFIKKNPFKVLSTILLLLFILSLSL